MSYRTSAVLASGFVAVVAALVLFGMRTQEKPPVSKVEKKPASVQAPAPSVPEERSFDCRVVPRSTVPAATSASGVVGRVLVNVGDMVNEGQVLAVVGEPAAASVAPRPRAAITPAAAEAMEERLVSARRLALALQDSVKDGRQKLAQASAEFAKQERLNREGATPRLVYETAKADRDQVASGLAAAEALSRTADNAVSKLEDQRRSAESAVTEQGRAAVRNASAEVHAPATGMVIERNIAPGTRVTDANRAALFLIAPQPELLRAEFDNAVPVGQRISIVAGGVLLSADVGEDGKSAEFESRMGLVRPGSPCLVTLK